MTHARHKEHMKKMTEGSPIRLIASFALPLLLGNLLQQTYNVMDAMIVGRILGPWALAGVGATSSVQFLIMGFCIGICCGFAIPIAQFFGAGDLKHMKKCLYHASLLCIGFAIILTVVSTVFCHQILAMLKISPDIYADAYSYLFIIFLGIPFCLLYNLLSGALRAVGDSKTPFMFLALSTILNIVLDLFCILTLHMGVAGAAIATVVAQAVSGLLCLILIWKKMPNLSLTKSDMEFSFDELLKMLIIGVPMGLQYSITAIGCMVMQAANNGLGSIYSSSFAAVTKIKQFAMCPFDAIATGVSVFCSQNLGAGKIDRVKTGINKGMAIGVTYGLLSGIIILFFGRFLASLFIGNTELEVLDAAEKLCFCVGTCFWSLGFLNVARMCVQGLGYSGRAIFSGVTEMVVRVVIGFWIVPSLGFAAICWTDQLAWVAGSLYIVPVCYFVVKKLEARVSRKNA